MGAAAEKETQGRRDRRAIARDLRKADRAELAALRARIKALRKEKRDAIAQIRTGCRGALSDLRAQRAALLRQAAELAARIRARRTRCGEYITATQAKALAKIEAAQAELHDRLRALATERVWTKPIMLRAVGRKAAREAQDAHGRERRSESDDAVLANIDAALVPVFAKVKRAIKGTPRMTRTEAFLHWVHDHPAEVYEIQEHERERELRALEAAERRMSREQRSGDRYRRSAPRMAADLEEIEF